MKAMLHIMRHDLRRCRWALLCWGLAFGYLFLRPVPRSGAGHLNDYLQLAAILVVLILSIGLIADFVQTDHPARDDAHWRTLPVSAGRMAAAKLALVGVLFVMLPLAAVVVRNAVRELQFLQFSGEYAMVGLMLGSFALSLTAVAACTRNVGQCVLVWLGLYLGTVVLADTLSGFGPMVRHHLAVRAGEQTMLLCLVLSVVLSLAVTLNQYLRRRLAVSVALLLAGAVGTAMLGAFHGYFHFYGA